MVKKLIKTPFICWDSKIEQLAMYLVNSIRINNPNASSTAVLKFSLKAYINFLIIIVFILGISIFTGEFLPSIIGLLSFPILRYFSGGLHLSSSSKCAVLSASIVLVCVYTPLTYWYNGLVLSLLSVILLALFAPSGIKQSKMKKENYPILKVTAIVIVSSNLFFHSSVISMAFFAQSITTIPVFEKWLDRLDL